MSQAIYWRHITLSNWYLIPNALSIKRGKLPKKKTLSLKPINTPYHNSFCVNFEEKKHCCGPKDLYCTNPCHTITILDDWNQLANFLPFEKMFHCPVWAWGREIMSSFKFCKHVFHKILWNYTFIGLYKRSTFCCKMSDFLIFAQP